MRSRTHCTHIQELSKWVAIAQPANVHDAFSVYVVQLQRPNKHEMKIHTTQAVQEQSSRASGTE